MTRSVSVGALWALFATLAACEEPSGVGACEADADCASPLACVERICAMAGPTALPLQLRVTPPADAGLPPQQFARLDPRAGTITLAAPLTVRGVIRPADDAFTVNVPGDIAFQAEGLIAGLPQRFGAPSLEGVDAAGDGFRVELREGFDYRVTFVPADATWPRVFFDLRAADLPGLPGGRLDPARLALPSARATLRLTGRVETLAGDPVPQARVAALTPRGELLAVTVADPVDGSFSMPISPQFPEVGLRIESPDSGRPFPEYRVDAVTVSVPAIITLPFDVDDTTTFEAHVRVVGGADGAPVAGVPVTVVGLLPEGAVRATALTDADGRARLRTFAGAYECLVAVPAGDPWASWHGYMTLGPDLTGASAPEIRLAQRPTLDVHVLAFNGVAVPHGVITFERDPSPGAGALAIAPEARSIELDPAGRTSLTLEPGTYLARYAPARASGAPMAFRVGFEVGTSSTALLWRLPQPSRLNFVVAGPEGAPLADTTVELWVPSTGGGDARLLGRALTDAGGALQVLVPHVEASP